MRYCVAGGTSLGRPGSRIAIRAVRQTAARSSEPSATSAIAISWCNRVDAERPEPAGEFRRAPVAGRDQLWELVHQALGELARGQDLRQLQPDEHQLMPDRRPLLVSPLIDRPETLTVTSRGLGATGHCASAGSDKANVSDSFGGIRRKSSSAIPPFGCTACQARISASPRLSTSSVFPMPAGPTRWRSR
jgi:hypothetical protein